MRVIAIANRQDADLGFVGERLLGHEARLANVLREDLAGLREPEAGADLIVLLGSDWSVYDTRHERAVAAEQALVRRAWDRGLPVLAICYGAQLVASALGLAVTRAAAPEIGWRTVQTDDEAVCPPGPWFQFHFDGWTDGNGLASSARTSSGPQAFRVGRTLGVQFHPEVTAQVARRWLLAEPDNVAAAGESVEAIAATLDDLMPDARLRCHSFVDGFLTEVAGADRRTGADRPPPHRRIAEHWRIAEHSYTQPRTRAVDAALPQGD